MFRTLKLFLMGVFFWTVIWGGENFVLNIEPEVMYGAGSGSGWGKFVLF